MLIMHNNKYLPLTGLLTLLQWTIHNTACIVLHPVKYFDIYGVKWCQYVTPVVVCEHLCLLVIEKCQLYSFDVHYSKICWKLYKNGISADLFVCIGCILIDVVRCSTTSRNFWNISCRPNISRQKKFMKFYITRHKWVTPFPLGVADAEMVKHSLFLNGIRSAKLNTKISCLENQCGD